MSLSSRSIDQAPAQSRRKLNLRGIAQLLIGVGALALVLFKSDPVALAEAVQRTRMAYFPLAIAASFAVTWLMAYRWGAILAARGLSFSTFRLFSYYLIGVFFTSFVPGGGVSGDVARLIYVNRDVRNKAVVLSTLVYERLIGVFILLFIGFAATVGTRAFSQGDRVIYLSELALSVAFISILLLMSNWVSSRIALLIRFWGSKTGLNRFAEGGARTLEDLSRMKSDRRLFVRSALISVMIRLVWSLGCYVVAWAMGLPLGLLTVFAFISLIDLIRLMPISVGGLGVREWTVIALFATAGISREQALTFSFLAFAPIYLNAAVGGIIYISTARLRDSRREEMRIPG